jgi:aspartate/methionine/tyrosine aminotransferase
VAVNPNNPTGSPTTREELARLAEICREHQLALIVDEVFLDYRKKGRQDPPSSAIAGGKALTFVLSGFAKILALPQAKLSWIHVSGPQRLKEAAIQRLEFITDTYLSVGWQIQLQAPLFLRQRASIQRMIIDRLEKNEAFLQQEAGIAADAREAGWYAIVNLPDTLGDEQCCLELLQRHNVIVHPGYFYDFTETNRLVVSLLAPETVFQEGILRLAQHLGYVLSR